MGNVLGGGDKNSPKTTSESSSTTKNTQIGGATTVSGGGPTTIGGATTLSDLTNTGTLNVTTTDAGAVAAGLSVAMRSLDAVNAENQLSATTQGNALDSAIGVATTVAQGQQNTSLKYILYGVVALAAVAGFAYVYSKSK